MPLPEPDRVAWLDVTAGVSGDMLLGAFVDAGVDLAAVQRHIDAVLPDTVRLEQSEVLRAGTRATKVDVHLLVEDQPQRAWADIRTRVTDSHLDGGVRDRALAAFGLLAEVEGHVHGTATDDVHFHEVGAWDSVADVVGVCAAVVELGITDLVASPIALGSGTVRTAHGQLAVPVPAVLGLISGWTVLDGGRGELATPTGVALVVALATSQGALPTMAVTGHGVGAGTRDPAERANVVRLVLGERAAAAPAGSSSGLESRDMVVLETNVDDLDPRVWPSVLDTLLRAGAADAWLVPILMKKGRPAHTLSVLAGTDDVTRLRDLVLDLTSTIGVRETPVRRWALGRGWVDVLVDAVPIAIKVAHRQGVIAHATPEFDDVVLAAGRLGRPVRDVLGSAVAAAVAAGLVSGADLPDELRDTAAG